MGHHGPHAWVYGQRCHVWFDPNKQGKAAPELLDQAERIFLSGRRVAAAVRDELEYFQKAVPEDNRDSLVHTQRMPTRATFSTPRVGFFRVLRLER